MLKVKLWEHILDGLAKLLKWHKSLIGFIETVRYWELMKAQSETFKAISRIDFEIESLKDEKIALQDKYDYIQQLKEVYCDNR